MTAYVLDASIALAWCFHDEATPASWRALERLETECAVAPSLLFLEVANVLALAERRGRISESGIVEFVSLLSGLPIVIDDEPPSRALTEVLALARAKRLTAYDAAYLELAIQHGVPIATKDGRLGAAAGACGVPVVGT